LLRWRPEAGRLTEVVPWRARAGTRRGRVWGGTLGEVEPEAAGWTARGCVAPWRSRDGTRKRQERE
jgi:hypothetical protein